MSEDVSSTAAAFAAKLADGSVVTWGSAEDGGDSSSVQAQLKGVDTIYSNAWAFAAKLADGSVVTWGDAAHGGDSSSVQAQLKGVDKQANNAQQQQCVKVLTVEKAKATSVEAIALSNTRPTSSKTPLKLTAASASSSSSSSSTQSVTTSSYRMYRFMRFNGLSEGVFVKNKFFDRKLDASWAMSDTALIEALYSQSGVEGTAAFLGMCGMIFGPCAPNYSLGTHRAYEDQLTGSIICRIFSMFRATQIASGSNVAEFGTEFPQCQADVFDFINSL